MSTPSISAPSRVPTDLDVLAGRVRARARRLVRGSEADPAWSRPALWLVALLAGVLTLWGLTRSGYANTYYAEAAQAASRNWTAWLTNALDASGTESLDKGPLSNMLMGLSGRLLGFSSFSMLLPEALCGVGAVLVLHNTVKRTLGHRAAILAALMLALTPIFVAMSRYNNPDALLVLLEVGAAWALVRALQSGRTREVLLCGVLVGLAFNVKMLQAYLIVPALAATLLVAGQGSVRRRVGQLLGGGLAMGAVSFAWYGTMMLIGAADRPWVGDTTDNSWFSLIFGANGFGRVSGEGGGVGPGGVGPGGGVGGGATFGGAAGPGRLFNSIVGGQIAWLLPLAAVGLALGLWTCRRAPRTEGARSAYVLWGLWAVVSWAVFSFSKGVFHPYYTTALAPAVAVLAAGGLTVLWDKARGSTAWTVALGAAVVGTAAFAAVLLGRADGFVPWLAPTAMVLAVLASTGLLLARAQPVGSAATRSRIAAGAAAVALVALLAGPAAYSIATVGKALNGGNPLAGPSSAQAGLGGPGGAPGSRVGRGGFARAGLPPGVPGQGPQGVGVPGGGVAVGAPPAGSASAQGGPPLFGGGSGASGGGSGAAGGTAGTTGAAGGFPGVGGLAGAGPGAGGGQVSKALVSYLKAHQGKAAYIVAAVGSGTAGSIALQSGREAIDMGGFMGSDPAPSLTKLKSFISSGQVHYVLLGGGGDAAAFGGAMDTRKVRGGTAPTQGGAGFRGGPGGSISAAGRASVQARDAWIEKHGTVVHASGASSGGATLYYFA